MSDIHTSLVGTLHSYTQSKVPWRLDEYREAQCVTTKGKRFGSGRARRGSSSSQGFSPRYGLRCSSSEAKPFS